MLVEDDPAFIRTLSDRLQDEGHPTREFQDPVEALEVLRRTPGAQEAILLDLGLPKMNGLGWLKKVRREGHPHPVALISGDVSVKDTKEMVNLGLTAMLLKPYSSAELREVLMRLEDALPSGNSNTIPIKLGGISFPWLRSSRLKILALASLSGLFVSFGFLLLLLQLAL